MAVDPTCRTHTCSECVPSSPDAGVHVYVALALYACTSVQVPSCRRQNWNSSGGTPPTATAVHVIERVTADGNDAFAVSDDMTGTVDPRIENVPVPRQSSYAAEDPVLLPHTW